MLAVLYIRVTFIYIIYPYYILLIQVYKAHSVIPWTRSSAVVPPGMLEASLSKEMQCDAKLFAPSVSLCL